MNTECTCGKCRTTKDANGNTDYGMEWNTTAGTYTPRDCPKAAAIRANHRH